MERTLEDWFAELDRLIEVRDGTDTGYFVHRKPTVLSPKFEISVGSAYRPIGSGATLLAAVKEACANIVNGARRVMQAT